MSESKRHQATGYFSEITKSTFNLLRAIETGIFNESTKERMNELEKQESELKAVLAAAKQKEDVDLKKRISCSSCISLRIWIIAT